MTQSLQYPDKSVFSIVSFSWHTTEVLLTDAGEDKPTPLAGGNPAIADPALGIDYGARKGGSEDGLTKITISRETALFADNLSSGRAHAPVTVNVYEFSEAMLQTPLGQGWSYPFSGRVVRARRNPGGTRGLVELECSPWKNRVQGKAGIQCNAECSNPFGKLLCGVDADSFNQTGTLSGISRNIVTITGLTSQPRQRWRRGFISFNGLSIQVRDTNGTDTFELAKMPPTEWLTGSTVTVRPGCDLLYSTCRDIWENEDNFNGLGFATPAYNPVIENPGY